MRNDLNQIFINFKRSFILLILLFKRSIEKPNINISSPVSFLDNLRDFWNRLFINISCLLNLRSLLFQLSELNPQIVIKLIMFKFLLNQFSTSCHYQIFHVISGAELLFKLNVVCLKFFTILNMINSKFIQYSSSIEFFLLCFKPSKVDEKVFIISFFTKFS